jgi:hypothetical protein
MRVRCAFQSSGPSHPLSATGRDARDLWRDMREPSRLQGRARVLRSLGPDVHDGALPICSSARWGESSRESEAVRVTSRRDVTGCRYLNVKGARGAIDSEAAIAHHQEGVELREAPYSRQFSKMKSASASHVSGAVPGGRAVFCAAGHERCAQIRPAAIGALGDDVPAPGVLKVTEQPDEMYSLPSLKYTSPETLIVAPDVGSTTPFTIRFEVALPVTLAGFALWFLLDHFGAWHELAVVVGLIVGGAIALGLDIRYRVTHHQGEGAYRFIHPSRGGNIWFVPLWFLGGATFLFGIGSVGSVSWSPPRDATTPPTSEPAFAVGTPDSLLAPSSNVPLRESNDTIPVTEVLSPFDAARISVIKGKAVLGDWKPISDMASDDPFYVMVVATWCPHSKDRLRRLASLAAAEKPWDIYAIEGSFVAESLKEQLAANEIDAVEEARMLAVAKNAMTGRILNFVAVYETEFDDLIATEVQEKNVTDEKAQSRLKDAHANSRLLVDVNVLRGAPFPFYALHKAALHELVKGFPSLVCCFRGSCASIFKSTTCLQHI